MNNIPYVHYQKDKNHLIHLYYVALIILFIFSIYKNGILLYQNGFIHFYSMFLPLYFYCISAIVGFFLAILLKKSKKEMILLCLIVACTISINTNMFIYPILLFIGMFIGSVILDKTKISFHLSTFSRILLILALFLQSYSYLNIGEKLGKFNYDLFDLFLGYGPGGLATSSLLLIIFCFFLLSSNRFYKKTIPIAATLTFLMFSGLYLILFRQYEFLEILCNGTIYFSFVFLATSFDCTPTSTKGMFIYGILIGILAFCFSIFLNIYEAGILSVFFCSLLSPLIDKILNNKFYKIQ